MRKIETCHIFDPAEQSERVGITSVKKYKEYKVLVWTKILDTEIRLIKMWCLYISRDTIRIYVSIFV